jgi:hypothetical protein
VRESVSGVGVLDKTVSILDALEAGPRSLAELAGATGLPRATTHRLAVALESHELVGRDDAGRFVLGARLARLGRAANPAGRSLAEIATPALTELRDRTGESTQLYVAVEGARICTVSLESPHSLRTIVAVGVALPLDRGSAAKVLTGEPTAVRPERGGAGARRGIGQRTGAGRWRAGGRGLGLRPHRAHHEAAGTALRSRGGRGGPGRRAGTGLT